MLETCNPGNDVDLRQPPKVNGPSQSYLCFARNFDVAGPFPEVPVPFDNGLPDSEPADELSWPTNLLTVSYLSESLFRVLSGLVPMLSVR